MQTAYSPNMMTGLPDPRSDVEFYEGVPSKRLFAWVIDAILIIVLSVLVVLVMGILTIGVAFFFAGFLFMVTGFLYRVVFLATKSATPGMALMGIQFRTIEGSKFELKEAIFHTGLYTVMVMTFFGQVGSIITMVTTEYGRSIPDIVLGSTAINKPLQ